MTTTTVNKTIIAKQTSHAFKKDVFLLGTDADGIRYWLEAASWECDWYWGFGYVETYTRNSMPDKARDIDSHQHIDSTFIGRPRDTNEYIHNIFDCTIFAATTFTESEGWTLTELFKTFYLLKESAALHHRGGTNTSSNPVRSLLTDKEQESHINKVLLPAVFEEIYKILRPTTDK